MRHVWLTVESAEVETRRSVVLGVAVHLVYFRSSFVLLLNGCIEFASMVAGSRLSFAVIAIDLKTSHFDFIILINALNVLRHSL